MIERAAFEELQAEAVRHALAGIKRRRIDRWLPMVVVVCSVLSVCANIATVMILIVR